MSPDLANFLFEAVNLLLLAAGLGWFFFKPVRRAIAAEQQRQTEADERIRHDRQEAERVLGEANRERASLEAQIAAERDELLGAANAQAETIRQDARAKAEQELARLVSRLEAERQRELLASGEMFAQVVGDAVRELLVSVEGPELQHALVRVACARLRQVTADQLGEVQVESARPLEPKSMTELNDALPAGFTARVAPELAAGVRVTTAAGQIDASALGFARHATEAASIKLRDAERAVESRVA
jgi:F0F1-type ATP synthase membrane subunit b/b'